MSATRPGRSSHGPDHPRVAIGLNNLAQLLQATNRLTEAEPLLRRALAITEAAHGPDHPRVATHLPKDEREAARLYRLAADQGRGGLPKDLEEAVRWYQRAAQAGDPSAQQRLRSLRRTW